MASKNIEVSTDDILRVRNDAYGDYETTLMGQFRDMTAAIEALSATWQGPNHDAFVTAYDARKDRIEAFHGVLEHYLKAWNTAARIYLTCESDVDGYIQ